MKIKQGNKYTKFISKHKGLLGTLVLALGVLLAQSQIFAAPATFSDDFNRADGAVGNGWTVEGALIKTYSILGQQVRGDDTSTSTWNNSRLTRQETSLNQTVTVDMKMGSVIASMGPLLREHGASTAKSTSYYGGGGNGIGISKVVAGTVTNIWNSGIIYNDTDTYRQEFSVTGANPTTLCLTVDNITTSTNIVNNHCVTDSTSQLQTAGKVALTIPKSTNFVDNFVYEYESSAQAPDAPTNFSATAGNTQTSLVWTAPSSDGGSAITDYVVQYKASADSTWLAFNDGTSTNTNATVTGLTNGTSYDFRVAAVNAVGTGTNSSTATATPTSGVVAPYAPTNLSATPASTQAALTWTAPSSDGGAAITDYIVQYKASADSTWLAFNDGTSTNTNATVTGLTNGTSYDFRVAAVNSVGTGAYSSVISATPAVAPLTYTVAQSDLWDNGYLQPTDHPYNSSFSRFVFNTTSDYVTVNMVTALNTLAPMGVKVDGVVQPSITTASNTINLGNLGQSKQIVVKSHPKCDFSVTFASSILAVSGLSL